LEICQGFSDRSALILLHRLRRPYAPFRC
jgi:hypothetical protein